MSLTIAPTIVYPNLGRGVKKAKDAKLAALAALAETPNKKMKSEAAAYPKMDQHQATYFHVKMTETEIASAELELNMASSDLDFNGREALFWKTWMLQRHRLHDEVNGTTLQLRNDFEWLKEVSYSIFF